MRSVFLAAVALAACVTSRASDACVIVTPQVATPTLQDAPLNTHVWLSSLPIPLFSGATFALVRSDARGQPIELDMRSWEEPSQVWQLVPAAPLAPRTRYEVWGLPRSRKEPVLVATFRTGSAVDTAAPKAPRIRHVVRSPSAMGCPPFLAVEGEAGADESGPVLHALWFARKDERIDYDAPPVMLFYWNKPTATNPRPSADIYGIEAVSKPGKIGLRTVDLAGQLSAPAEFVLPDP